ncbi:MAG TPA: 50S ribosome-binding GTPase, partial [Methanocorpusculum sp.]|nr:50S ribosome-binding GTPase [Methanocorpusculum sp.]
MKKAVLLGNPNVGKSLIFNALTGLGVEISNYPGTTVTVQTGPVKHAGKEFTVTDLPGAYSLAGDSVEEQMVREYLASENPDLFVVILNSATLEKGLFLLLQIADFGKPVLAVLNMTDDAEKEGRLIDADRLSEIFGIPFIKTVATEGKNLDVLAETILKGNIPPAKSVTSLDEHIKAAKDLLQEGTALSDGEVLFALEGIRISTVPDEIMETAEALGGEIERLH